MSVLGKKWFIKNQDDSASTIEKLLANRKDLDLNEKLTIHDPFLFSDMEKAVERIQEAIKNNERIIIFGDYDVDGISGTAILYQTLKNLGASVSYRLPNRLEDGYGLSKKFIKEFVELDLKLLITVDCGISNADLITEAKQGGIDTIITDHHTVPENVPTDARAIIHPQKDENYPYSFLTGSAVAFKLAQALIGEKADELIDLATLGVIADLGPLTGENRAIVKKGLVALSKTKWAGLKKLIEFSNLKGKAIDPTAIGFRIAPRINAAGRIGDPYLALSLLLQDDKSTKTHELGQKLEDLNKKRQEMTFQALEEAEAHFSSKVPYILIAENPDWHVGILGLIGGRLTEKYARPSIILQDFGDTLVASARSIPDFNIVEALTEHKDLLETFGGHAQAAGFNIKKENYKKFKKAIQSYAGKKLKKYDLKPIIQIDCKLPDKELNFEFLKKLEDLEPFGMANSRPIFLLKNIKPLLVGKVGREKNHLKFSIQTSSNDVQVIGFNLGEHSNTLRQHRSIDLVCHLNRNRWNNRDSLQIQAIDFKVYE